MPTPAPNTYPFDGSGTAATNLVSNENQSLTLTNYRDYNFVIPNFAPFFADSLKVKHRESITSPLTTLTEGIDYYPALSFVGATRATAKPVYGAISFTNLKLTGFLEITYQTVGGEWTLSVQKITELAANVIYNPRTTTWETLVNVPAYFPPLDHAWKLDDLVGQKEVLAGLDSIEKAILNKDAAANLLAHTTNYGNPHRTSKNQVGLGKVQNYSTATLAESVEARRNDLYTTPVGVKAFFDSLGLDKDLSFVSLEEVVTRKSVPKILTFDLFLEYMKLYGNSGSTAPIETGNIDRPIVIYPQELDNFLKGQPFKCTTYVDAIPGTITRIMDLTGTGTHTIPRGTNSLSITGRGGIGTEFVAKFVVKTKTVSATGSGSFIVPAGGNILSLRGRGAPGFISNDIGVYKPTNNGSLVNLPTPVVNPGDPTWTYELVSKFSSTYVINSIMNSIVLTIDLKKNYSNNLSVVSNNIPCTLLLTNKSSDGILLTYRGTITTAFSDTTLLTTEFELKFERLPGTNISSGNEVTVSINTATIKFPGSTDLLAPNARIDDITLNPNTNAVVNYSSPAGTELDIIYQDFTNTGEWKISKFYSSKITNSSTGSSSLVEDTIGNVIVLPLAATGEFMVDKTSITLDASPILSSPMTLSLVAGESSSNKRVFENIYTIANTIVSVRVISEYILNTGLQSKGSDAIITIFNTVHKFEGSPDNDTLPITRTDDIILDIGSATTVTYSCPTGASIVLEYKEPNAAQPIAHSDTEWEVSKADSFVPANILDSTVLGKGTGFSLTTWKPTHQDSFINNSDYYVRCRWVKSNATKSDWSDTRKFIFSVGAVNQPKDKELSRWCINLDQWGTYADGNGGSYDRIISSNSVACGYVTPALTQALPNTIAVQLMSDLNVAYNGHNIIFTAVINNTKSGTIYECELQQKYITESDYNYSKVNVSTVTSNFTGDANSTTLRFSLAYSDIGAGNRVFKYRVTQSGFPVNTAVSSPININFSTPVTDNPVPTGPTPSTTAVFNDGNLKLTLTSSRTDIRVGDNEVLTVMLTGGIPGNEYQLLMISKNSTRLNDNGTSTLLRITANNSGTGTFSVDGGNDGSIPLGLYFTVVETLGRQVKVSSNTVSRNFLGAYTNPRIVCSIVGSTDIDIGETRMARVDISGFDQNKTYTLRWYRTLPNSANRTVWNMNGTQITNNVVTSASGTGSIEIPVSNDGTIDAGAWRFDVDAYDSVTNALVPTPGGNVEGVYNILVNTSITILSNISYPNPIYTSTIERITYTVSRAAANRTLNFVSRSTFVSGNTALLGGGTIDTNTPVDTLITVTTNSSGTATVVKEFTNSNNRIPGGSVWQRQALLTGTNTVSNILQSKYANSAIAFKLESSRINSGNSAINMNDPDTISYGLNGLQSDVRYTIKWLYKVNTGPWVAAANIADTGFNSTSDRYTSSITPLIRSPNTTDQTHTLYLKAIVYDNANNPTESNDLQWNYNNPNLQAFSPTLTSVKNGTAINRGTSDSITLNISNVKQSRYALTWYTILDSNKSAIFNGALPTEITPTATTFNGSYTLPIDVGSVVQPRTLKYGVDIVEVVTNTTRSPVELSYTYSDQNNAFTIGISCNKQSQTVTRNSVDTISIVAQNITPNASYRLNWYYQLGAGGVRTPLHDPILPTTINVNSSSTTINRQISIGYGVVCSSLTNLNYYVDIVDSNNTVVSSATPSGVSWMFDPSLSARLVSTRTNITTVSNKDTLTLTLNNLELNSTYQLTWYYRIDSETSERRLVPNPNLASLPSSITTTDKNSVGIQYTNIAVAKDITLTDANSLIYYSVVVNKQGDLAELTESNRVSWIWSSGATVVRLPIATATLGSSGIISLPITTDNNTVMLNGSVSQLELNKLYKAEWYVTLPGTTESLIIINGNTGDSFSEIGSTTHPLTSVSYVIPRTVSDGQISFRLLVYQNDNKTIVQDSSSVSVVVNKAPTIAIPKPTITIIVLNTDPSPITAAGGKVYVQATVSGLVSSENYDLVWNFKKPTSSQALGLVGPLIPTSIDAFSQTAAIHSKTLNIEFNTNAMPLGGSVVALFGNIELVVTQRSNPVNFNNGTCNLTVEPAPTIVPLAISDKSSSVNTQSIENKTFSSTLSVTVDGLITGRFYAVMWKYKRPLENTESLISINKSMIRSIGGNSGTSSDTYTILDVGPNAGQLILRPYVYEVIEDRLQGTGLATDSIYVDLTLPVPSISLSVHSTIPSTGINTATTNASVKIQTVLGRLVSGKNYTLSWKVKYPNDVDLKDLPSSNNTSILATGADKTVVTTFSLTDTSLQGDVTFHGIITQVGNVSNTNTDNTPVNIADYLVPTPNITNVNVGRQNPTIDGWYLNATDLGINMSADISNLVLNEIYDYKWEAITPAPAGSVPSVNTRTITTGTTTGRGPLVTNTLDQDTGTVDLGNILGTFTVKLTVTSRNVPASTNYSRVNKTIIAKPIGKPDVSGVASNITTFTEGTLVSDMTVSCNVKGLTSGDDYYLGFYYKLSGDSSERLIGSATMITASDPTNNIPYTSVKIPYFNTNANTSVDVSARVYSSRTNSIRDDKTTNYAITAIGTPRLSDITSTKITYNTNETFNSTLSATASDLIDKEKYDVRWEAIVNGTSVAVTGGTTTVTASGTSASLQASVSNILTGNIPNGTVVYKLTITSQTNVNKKANKEITYGITNPTTPTISNLTTSPATFAPSTNSQSVTLNATLGSLIAGKTYTVSWWYKLSSMSDFVKFNTDTTGLTSADSVARGSGSFISGSVGTNSTVTFKAIISIVSDPNVATQPAITNPLPITDGTTPIGTVNRATIGALVSSAGSLKIGQAFNTTLSAPVSGLTPGVTYTCDWWYRLDTGGREAKLGTSNVSSTSGGSASLTTPQITVPQLSGSTAARTITFDLEISATGAQTATASGGQTNVNYTATASLSFSPASPSINGPVGTIYNQTLILTVSNLTIGSSIQLTNASHDNGTTISTTINHTGANTYTVISSGNYPSTPSSSQKTVTAASAGVTSAIATLNLTANPASGAPAISLSVSPTSLILANGATDNVTLSANTTNITPGSAIGFYNGSSFIANGTWVGNVASCPATITGVTGVTSATFHAKYGTIDATATLGITVTGGGSGGPTINTLTAVETGLFNNKLFDGKLTLNVTGLTPNKEYQVDWRYCFTDPDGTNDIYSSYPIPTSTDGTNAKTINTSSTSVTKTVTLGSIDPVGKIITNGTPSNPVRVRFQAVLGSVGMSDINKKSINYTLTADQNTGGGGLSATLKLDNNTTLSKNDKTAVSLSVTINGATVGTKYEFMNQYRNSTEAWVIEDNSNYIIADANGNQWTSTNKPAAVAATSTTHTINLTVYTKNRTTSSITKKLSLLVYKQGDLPVSGVTSSEVTLTIGPKVVTATHPTINLGFNTPVQNNIEAFWEDLVPVTISTSNARPNATYTWTVAIANVGTTNDLQSVKDGKWSFGTNLWGAGRTTDPLAATTSELIINTSGTFSLPKTLFNNEWGVINPILEADGVTRVPDGGFREFQVCIAAYDGDPDLNFNIEKVTLSDTVKIKFWQKNNQPVITLNNRVFNLYWDGDITFGGDGGNVNNIKTSASYSYTIGLSDPPADVSIPAVQAGSWRFGMNPFLDNLPTDPTAGNVNKGTFTNASSSYYPIPAIPIHSPWNNGNWISNIPLNGSKTVKAIIIAHINDGSLNLDKVVLSPEITVILWNKPNGPDIIETYNPSVQPTVWHPRTSSTLVPGSEAYLYWSDLGELAVSVSSAKPNTPLYYLFYYHTSADLNTNYYDSSFSGGGSTDMNSVGKSFLGTTDANGEINTNPSNTIPNKTFNNPYTSTSRIPGIGDGGELWVFLSVKVMEQDGTSIGTSSEFIFRMQQANP